MDTFPVRAYYGHAPIPVLRNSRPLTPRIRSFDFGCFAHHVVLYLIPHGAPPLQYQLAVACNYCTSCDMTYHISRHHVVFLLCLHLHYSIHTHYLEAPALVWYFRVFWPLTTTDSAGFYLCRITIQSFSLVVLSHRPGRKLKPP